MPTDRQRLMNAARQWLASQADAEDAVQDTHLRALLTFPHSAPEPAWAYAVLRNIAIDRLRRRQSEAAHRGAELTPASSSESLLEMRSDCETALRHLLSRVNPAEAAAILLRDVFEYGYDEIGRLCGKSEDASRQFLHRARTRAQRIDPKEQVDEAYVALCWRAIETRDSALLMKVLQITLGQARAEGPRSGCLLGARSTSLLVQENGRYAIALVLDKVILCVIPLDNQTMTMDEPA